MKVLVTGAAGFIGSRLMHMLAERGDSVVGVDNINDYYDVRLKYGRLAECGIHSDSWPWGEVISSDRFPSCRFIRMSIEDKQSLDALFADEGFEVVLHMAAQTGVRYSIADPYAYLQSNLAGFLNVLEACRHNDVGHLVFASSSSVYGMNDKVPYNEEDKVDTPVSLYAATKKSNELMAHSYAKLYGIRVTGLRFFTVYGPWGRPDMAPMLFARAMAEGRPLQVFNNGDMVRDFTYIDDIADGVMRVIDVAPSVDSNDRDVPYKIYNIGSSNPVKLMDFISEMETAMGIIAEKEFLPMQPGDVLQTFADVTSLERDTGYRPSYSLAEGIREFVRWFNSAGNPYKK